MMMTTRKKIEQDELGEEGKMSRPERLFQSEGYLLFAELLPAGVFMENLLYEWVSFKLPGGRYTPDFMLRLSNREEIYIEVKQESVSKRGRVFRGQSYRDSRSKLRAAASLNPWYKFYMAIFTRGGWKLERIEPDPFFFPSNLREVAYGQHQ